VLNFQGDRNLNNNRISRILNAQSSTQNLSLVKNIFSPDNDGKDDSLLIQYNFYEANGKLNISVYNLNGKLIRKLINQKVSTKSGIIAWDGADDNRAQSPIGIYIIYLEYKTSKTTITRKTSAVLARKLN
jgi:flagellar hook assembly protein FlgD